MAGDIGVSVDRDFARFGSKSYAINKINTVDVEQHRPHSRNAAIVWGFLALLTAAFLAGGGVSIGLVALFAFFAFMAWKAWQQSSIVEYRLVLATSSGSVQAVKSRDVDFIFDTRRQIEQAIAGTLEDG